MGNKSDKRERRRIVHGSRGSIGVLPLLNETWSEIVVRNQQIELILHGAEILFLIFMAIGLAKGIRVAQETKSFIKQTLELLGERDEKDGRTH